MKCVLIFMLCYVNRCIALASYSGMDSRPSHTKDHHKNGTNCLPAWHAMR